MTVPESENKGMKQKREPARLTGKLEASLFTYAIAASAAGIGMVAQTPAAEAEVVATQANISVPVNGGLIQFDINRDGQMDFGLSWRVDKGLAPHHKTCSTNCGAPFTSALIAVPAQAANEVWQMASQAGFFGSNIYCAAALAPGQKIGPNPRFKAGDKAMFWFYAFIDGTFSACKWENGPRGPYLGVKFLDTSGSLHYGWVRVSLGTTVTITGYAFETQPNTPITTGITHGPVGAARLMGPVEMVNPGSPMPGSLGVLALGTPGLAAWRRPEEEPMVA